MNAEEYVWTVQVEPDAQDVQTLRDHLSAFNVAKAQVDQGVRLAIFLKDPDNSMIGGAYGWLWGAALEIVYLWVHESLRGQGVGRRLMRQLEQAAAERGCRQVSLDTYSFQAPAFYEKLGYKVFGVVEGYSQGHKKFFYRKQLSAPE